MFHLRDSGVKFSLWHQILEHMNHRRQCDMSSSKKITYNRTLRPVFICLREREGELNQREGKRGNSSQRRVKNTNMTD